MRNLATIQEITNVRPIPNADAIECVKVLGWQCVVKKSDGFKVGDKVVYVEVDSIMPDKPEYDFLRDSKGFIRRLRTIKLRGQISQGLVLPLSVLPDNFTFTVGTDVTEVLGVTKWEQEVPASLRGKQKSIKTIQFPKWMPEWARKIMGKYFLRLSQSLWNKPTGASFPPWIPKTDETRVQVLQNMLEKYEDVPVYWTEKLDGSSITIYLKDWDFGVCSRNIDLKEESGNAFWDTVRKLRIEEKLKRASKLFGMPNVAIQGELIGPGIQGNKYKLVEKDIYFFNVYDINNMEYLGYEEAFEFIDDMMEEKFVPVIYHETLVPSSDYYVESAKGKSVLADVMREGIVIRPVNNLTDFEQRGLQSGRISFKAINPEFLLKFDDN